MTPHEFIKKWKPVALTERAAAHSHFLDLCAVVEHEDPVKADPTGDWFTFEKGVTKTSGGEGFADVWKKGFFAWEYKKKKRDLNAALDQLVRYAAALENPPLQVACDTDRFVIRTAWTNAVPKTYEFSLDDLAEPDNLAVLRAVFHDPDRLRPKETRAGLTKEAADKFSTIAQRLQGRGTPEEVAHFVNQLVFCFFANSIKLLPNGFFGRLLKRASEDSGRAKQYFDQLFAAMEKGGDFDLTPIAHFNGGLFDGRRALPLEAGDVGLLIAAASLDWSQIDPSIFGTLFERFLDPEKRGQIGAHYTDSDKIMMIVEPVVLRPLRKEWEQARAEIEGLLLGLIERPMRAKMRRRMSPVEAAEEVRSRFLERLRKVTILDPACGSGNFLYLALQGVKDIENKANLECEALGLAPRALVVGPEILHGIEINALAAELARTTIWIGDIQWRRRNGIYYEPPPILRKLDSIECRDALVHMQSNGKAIEAVWPPAEFIVGNPPFLGAKLMIRKLGRDETADIRNIFKGRLAAFTDLVCYWFEKARAEIMAGRCKQAGLVATNSIRKNTNLPVLKKIVGELTIFEAWSEEQWTIEGANVDVSLVCFGKSIEGQSQQLNGVEVVNINADLTTGIDLTLAGPLAQNAGWSFLGIQKSGPFDVPGRLAREWALSPANPNGRTNSQVLKPYRNGDDLAGSPRDVWFIDLPLGLTRAEAALWEAPFQHLTNWRDEEGKSLRELREVHGFDSATERWWEPWRPRPEMRAHIERLSRYLVTAETAEYRIFIWLRYPILPDKNLIVIPRDDDTTFGILQSRFHEAWALRKGSDLEDRPRYTSSTTFETFPFPEGLTPNIPAQDYKSDPRAISIAKAAKRLDELRNAWLNPIDLVRIEPEVLAGFPDRIVPKDAQSAVRLRSRTLTNLYNERPQWLDDAHRDLDAAVAAAYGWPADISEEDALGKLLELNLARAKAGDLPLENGEDDDSDDETPAKKAPVKKGPTRKRGE